MLAYKVPMQMDADEIGYALHDVIANKKSCDVCINTDMGYEEYTGHILSYSDKSILLTGGHVIYFDEIRSITYGR